MEERARLVSYFCHVFDIGRVALRSKRVIRYSTGIKPLSKAPSVSGQTEEVDHVCEKEVSVELLLPQTRPVWLIIVQVVNQAFFQGFDRSYLAHIV